MTKYRKKPVVIEATCWYPSMPMYDLIFNFAGIGAGEYNPFSRQGEILVIRTLEGDMYAQAGDWILKGVKGEFYPCKPDIFQATYEIVKEEP